MKIIALEEHFATPELIAAWKALPPQWQEVALKQSTDPRIERQLIDLEDERLAQMDEAGVDIQVLSVTTPGVQSLEPAQAVDMARRLNDLTAETVRRRPDRFQGFATLPTGAPEEAARELERAVRHLGLNGAMLYGRTRERNLDHPAFTPILEAAAALRAPLYLHPQSPQPAVRQAYYDGFDDKVSGLFATAGIGWHYETGIQVLRLILSGAFDRLPDLQLILGHWGEVVLFYLDRLDNLTGPAGLPRPVSDYFKTNMSVAPSGVFSPRYLRWAIEVLGAERILFALDYPYQSAPNGGARRFIEDADLSEPDRTAIASGNWQRLVADIRR